MSQVIAVRTVPAHSRDTRRSSLTTLLLTCGVLGGPLFIVVALVQSFIRPGFDLRRHAISMLSLGDLGWVQVANFVATGVLALACAVGMRRLLHPGPAGTCGPLLVGAYGVGMVAAGMFPTDAGLGFPPGALAGMPATYSWHAIVHSVAFFVLFISISAACLVLARRFAALKQRGWAASCIAIGLAAPALVVLGMFSLVATGVAFFIAATLISASLAANAARLLSES